MLREKTVDSAADLPALKERGYVFADACGDLVHVCSVADKENLKPMYSGEATYTVSGDGLLINWITTKAGVGEFNDVPFESEAARVRGFKSLMTGLEDMARKRGCSTVKISTWMFAKHPRLMKSMGYAPVGEQERRLHGLAAGADEKTLIKYSKKL